MILLFGVIFAIVPSSWSACGGTGTLTPQNPTYSFTTPNYPSPHPAQETCRWQINAPSSTTELKLECQINTAQISGCSSTRFSYTYGYGWRTLCGTGFLSIKSPRPSITFKFSSKLPSNSNYKGLSCKVSYTPKQEPPTPKPFPPDPNCKCGQKGTNRIVGGEEATPNEYPWQALFMYKANRQEFCGGSIITKDWILSAAHCFEGLRDISLVAVVLGEHDYSKADPNTQTFDVEKIISHAKYNIGPSYNNDIALVKLKTPATYKLGIYPICLPFNYVTVDLLDKSATVSGWGYTIPGDKGSISKVLKELDMKLIRNTECANNINDYQWYPYRISENMVCAIADKQSPCHGDSGGPVVWENPDNKFYFQVGIVSFGATCASARAPVVLTKVQNYMDWIKEKTGAGINEFCIK